MPSPIHRNAALACVVLALLALPLHARAVHEQMLVSPDWLQRRLGTVTLLHIGGAAGYDASHISGAVLVEISSLLAQRDGTPKELPPIDVLERVFRAAARAWFTLDYLVQGNRMGVTRQSANIVFCRTGMDASMTYFVLRYLGYDAALYGWSFIEWSNAGEMVWS